MIPFLTSREFETDWLIKDFTDITRKDIPETEDITITDPRQKPKKEFNHPRDSVMAIIYARVAMKQEREWSRQEVYDLVEPFRWLVEYSVYKLANSDNYQQSIKKKDYTWTREGKIVMDSDLIKRFLELLERKFQAERPYRFKHGLKMADGNSMCQEITIAKISVQNLADFV